MISIGPVLRVLYVDLAAGVLCAIAAGNGVGCEEHECACAAQGGPQLGRTHVNHTVLRGVLEVEKAPQILGGVASLRDDLCEKTLRVVMVLRARSAASLAQQAASQAAIPARTASDAATLAFASSSETSVAISSAASKNLWAWANRVAA